MSIKAALVLFVSIWVAQAAAQNFPNKPVHLVVPLTPGSGADITARILSKKLQELWGQPVLIDNRPGAGGQIGSQLVAKAAPDGYTLLVQSSSHAANPAIYKTLPYDPTRDFVDIALLAYTPYVMVGSATGPFKNLQDIVTAAKASPGALPYASAGIGTSTHLTAELFAQRAGVKVLHVPFKGSPDAITDVIGGRSAFYMAPLPTVAGMLKDGRIVALAVTSEKRVERLVGVPTVAESGLAGFKADLWFGLWAPAGVPAEVIAKIAADINRALQSDEVKEQYAKAGNEVRALTPAEFARFVRDEMTTNKALVQNAGIQPE
jgi:tripartite-type tricarboxylate transporter receptor subunit TctC